MMRREDFALLALTPSDGRYAKITEPLRAYLSEFAFIKYRVVIEINWLVTVDKNLSPSPLSDDAVLFLNSIITHFSLTDAALVKEKEETTQHDVKAIEYFLVEKAKDHPEIQAIKNLIHFGLTSEDVNNLAYGCMVKEALTQCIIPKMRSLLLLLTQLTHQHAKLPMMGHTHGQPATPTTLGKEFGVYADRLYHLFKSLVKKSLSGKLNGATGNYSALAYACPSVNWQEVSECFVQQLGLNWNPISTQIESNDSLIKVLDKLKNISAMLRGLDQDIWYYNSIGYLKLHVQTGQVGSSTMPHKINPIDFENSEGNFQTAISTLGFMSDKLATSRLQRDLSGSTVLRRLGTVFSDVYMGLHSLEKGLKKIEPDAEAIQKDLHGHPELLAEPIQTVFRLHNIENPYEKLKFFTQGKTVSKADMDELVRQSSLPDEEKTRLLALTPETYTGLADQLAEQISTRISNKLR